MQDILTYFLHALAPSNLLVILTGTVVGIIVGALPGFTATMGIAILIPLTYTWNASTALIFLGAIYCGSMYGGSISAILINTPGTAAAAATAMDGYAMTRHGRPHEALTEAAVASFWGGQASTIALLFFAPVMAKWAFNFGAQEKFLMAAFGLTIIASLSTKSILKGLMMGCVGLLLACVGMDPVMGRARFTFGTTYLMGGLTMIPAVIGLFSVSQVFSTLKDALKPANPEDIARYKSSRVHLKDFVRYPLTYLRSSIIGIIVGIIPGTGGDVSSYVSYNMGKLFSKERDQFGDGSREGVACCEAANNAVTGGTLIPTLTLGIPGNATTAILLSGLTIHGLAPGYSLFTSGKNITYPFIMALFLANLAFVIIGLLGAKYFARVTLTPQSILSACVLNLSLIGCYGVRGNIRDVYAMLAFGLVGYLLKLYKFNIVPMVLGMILGDIAEEALQQGLILYNGSVPAMFATFFQRPICVVLMLLMIVSVCAPFIMEARKGKQSK